LEKIEMKRKTRNISMFFAHVIMFSLIAIVVVINGWADDKSAAPDQVKASEASLPMDAQLLREKNGAETLNGSIEKTDHIQVQEAEVFNTDTGGSEKTVPTDQAVPENTDFNTVSSISVSSLKNGILVSVIADVPIDQYKSFTTGSAGTLPARIFVDMFRFKSPYNDEKIIPVNQKMVESVRYKDYTDRVRIIIDTQKEYLASFVIQPVKNGLEIRVGAVTQEEVDTVKNPVVTEPLAAEASVAEETVLISEDLKSGDQTNSVSTGSALVNRIEFAGLPAGKSVVTVGTTSLIRYEIKEMSDRKIILKLLGTRLPEHQKRPLITTRFESAVDRVIPIQTASMKDSILSIELREKVGYQTEQEDNVLQIRFDASSVPPKHLDEASLPPWRQMMAQTLEESASPVMMTPEERKVLPHERRIFSKPETRENVDVIEPIEPVKRHMGEKIALDFFETDIRNVFRILREVSGKNFAIARDVTGTVTLTLEKPIPWDQVLDLVLRMNQLGKVEENDVIRIARMATITKEKQDRQDQIIANARLQEEEKAAEPLMTEYFPVNYSDARADILPKLELISTRERGIISVDTRTNMVIMTDTAEKIRQAREIIQRLDMVTPQVIIEARIVEVSSNFSREIGIQWDLQADRNESSTLGGIWGYDSIVNLPPSNRAGSIGFQFSRIFGTPLLIDARLSAIETLGEGKIVSAPKVMTLNNKKAIIKQGREIPYSVIGADGQVNTQFKDVDLLLEVIPHVTPDDRVTLRVLITKDEIAEFSVDGVPSLSTKRAETELLVNDGETIVIGGILLSNEQKTVDAIPGLGKVPVLKWLFKRDFNTNRKEELLIFLTPRIMRLEQKAI
jgi:type IV pilus assembly protein PilQ